MSNVHSEDSAVQVQKGMATEDCAICMSIFRHPKLLECRHTYCAACLKKLHSSSKDKSKIQCPVCRHKSKVQNGSNIENLLTNFFVSTLENVYVCDICDLKSEEPFTECGQCAFTLCKKCYADHRKKGDKNRCRDNDSDDDDDDELYPDDPVMRGTIRHLCQTAVKSCYCGNIFQQFHVEGATNITKIVPICAKTAWVLPDQKPEVLRYNVNGQIEERRRIGKGKTLDICVTGEGSLLAICEGISVVFKCTQVGPMVFIDTGNYLPVSLSNYKNNGLLVGAVDQGSCSHVENFVLVYNHKQQLTDIRGIDARLAFRQIVSLIYNFVTNQIVVADMERNMVYLLEENMKFQSYKRRMNFPMRRRPREVNQTSVFTPTSVCCDHDGTNFVFDRSSSSIHVLNSKGKLIGMLVGNDEDHTGDPSCVCFAPDKKLWIGDTLTGQIRVYSIDQVYNKTHSSRREIDSLPGLSETLEEQLGNLDIGSSFGLSSLGSLVSMGSETGDERRQLLRNMNMDFGDFAIGTDTVRMAVGPNGLHISSSEEPENEERNRQIRMSFLHHALNSSRLQSHLIEQGIALEDVVRACTCETN